MTKLKIVHVIERFASTGPERAIISAAKVAERAGLPWQRTVCALEAAASPITLTLARQAGIQVLRKPDPATLYGCLADADIVQVHYWNNPALQAFLRSDLPPMRLTIYAHIFGQSAPQVITRALLDFADVLVFTSRGSFTLPVVQQWQSQADWTGDAGSRLHYILAPVDRDRLEGFVAQPHSGFHVGYAGVVNFAKLHPSFVAMSAAVRIPNVQFIVCGAGGESHLAAQAQTAGAADRFQFRGYVENIRTAFAEFDLFGYPLRPDTYAASELVLQEAMWLGIPPVVFPYGGVGYLVQDGVTGLVVASEQAYTQAVERLYHAPELRLRLGANAREYARTTFDPARAIQQFSALYDGLLQQPKRTRQWPDDGRTPAAWFVAALGDQGEHFSRSLQGPDPLAETAIAAASDLLFSGEGGIVHYRNAHPEDPHLHFWTGLVLRHRGRLAHAQAEFAAAGVPRSLPYTANI